MATYKKWAHSKVQLVRVPTEPYWAYHSKEQTMQTAMFDQTPERLAEPRRNDEVASHDRGSLYRLKSDFSLEYWRGALEAAFEECAQIERALGLPPEVHTRIYSRLKQWESLVNLLEEVRDVFDPTTERLRLIVDFTKP